MELATQGKQQDIRHHMQPSLPLQELLHYNMENFVKMKIYQQPRHCYITCRVHTSRPRKEIFDKLILSYTEKLELVSDHLAANPRVSVALADAILPLILHEVSVGHV